MTDGPPVVLFLGKGGVGKTTCAAATALHLADAAVPTLVMSTDPTPSLSHIFDRTPGGLEQSVSSHLFLTELGLDEVRRMWDEQFGRDVYAVFSAFVDIDYESFVEFITSVLPGLNEEFMVDYVRRLAVTGRYQHIVWDTAPLGQTLALLGMPTLLAQHLRTAPRIYSHLRTSGEGRESIIATIRRWQSLAKLCMQFLRECAYIVMVTIPETLALRQLDGAFAELARYGLEVHQLVVNNVIGDADSGFLRRKAAQQQARLRELARRYPRLPSIRIPLFSEEVRGVDQLRQVGAILGPVIDSGMRIRHSGRHQRATMPYNH